MAKAYLIRAISLAATLTLGVCLAAAPERCGLQVVPQHDPNSTPHLAPIGISADGRFLTFASYAPLLARRHERAKRHLRLRYEHEAADDGVRTRGR